MIRVVPWSQDAERYIARALNAGGLADTRREVERGISQLWEFADADGLAGYAVTRLERYASGTEWCWVACAGRDFAKFARMLKAEAERRELPIRVHLTSKVMRHWYARLGFVETEIIMRANGGYRSRRQEFA